MKILIQHRSTKRFLTQDGKWVKAWKKAAPFLNPFSALRFCAERGLEETEITIPVESLQPATNRGLMRSNAMG